MYKGFFEDMEYVMGLFFKPFEDCCADEDDKDEDEKMKCGMGCDDAVCFRDDDEDEKEADDGKACDSAPCMKNEEDEDEPEKEKEEGKGGGSWLLGPGPMQNIMKCMFDASDIDYDYED